MKRSIVLFLLIGLFITSEGQVNCVSGNCMNGKGEVVTDKYSAKGTFKDGMLIEGRVEFSSGNISEGKFKDGQLIEGKKTFKEYFEMGKFLNGELHDKSGERTFNSGNSFKGEFVEGAIIRGKRIFSKDDAVHKFYEGEFGYEEGSQSPSFHGIGTLHMKNGNTLGPKWVYGNALPSNQQKASIPHGNLSLEMHATSGVFEVKGTITNGQHVLSKNFILDTGASLVVLPWSTVVELGKQDMISSVDNSKIALTTADGSTMDGMKFIIKQIDFDFIDEFGKVKPVSLKNIEAVVNTNETEMLMSALGLSDAPTLLGQSALTQLRQFTMDYTNKRLLITTPN